MKPKFNLWTCSLACLFVLLAASPGAAQLPEETPSEETAADGEAGVATEQPEQRQGAAEKGGDAPRSPEEALARIARGTGDGKIEIVAQPQPPDGVWLKDEEGKEFFWLRLPKSDPWYWADQEKTRIRYRQYQYYEVDREEEDAFYVRLYKRTEVPRPSLGGRTEEELEAIRAGYSPGVGLVDRLRLAPFDEGLPDEGQWRNGFDVADMNGDGHADIIHAPPRKLADVPVIFLGDGAGSWRVWRTANYPDIGYAYGDAKVADFNGDGHQDIALAMHVNGMAVLLGDGEGGFTDWSEGLDSWRPGEGKEIGYSSRTLRVADWNSDGRPDLVTLGEGPRPKRGNSGAPIPDAGSFGIVVYLNQGDGTWARLDAGSTDGNLFGDSMVLGDFNADGRWDVATSSSTLGLRTLVHFGEEGGKLRPAHLDLVRGNSYIKAVAVNDFDGDGRDDLAYSYSGNEDGQWRSGIDLLLSRDGESWERRPLYLIEEREQIFALTSGDVDGDGNADVVGLDGEGGTFIFTRTEEGWGLEAAPEMPRVEDGCKGSHAMVVDLDGDGHGELVEAFAGEPSALFAPSKCLSRGALRAWRVAAQAAG